MPILEALAGGIPSACSERGADERRSWQARCCFDPTNVDAICAALESLTTDEALRRRLGDAGPRRAAEFSWNAAAHATLNNLLL